MFSSTCPRNLITQEAVRNPKEEDLQITVTKKRSLIMMIVIINNHKDKEITSSSMVITTGIKKMPEKMTIHTLQQRQSLREVRTATEEVEEGTKVVTTINISLPEAELEV